MDAEMAAADQSGRKRSLSGGTEDSDSKYAAVEEEVESPSVPVAPPPGVVTRGLNNEIQLNQLHRTAYVKPLLHP